MYVIKRNGTKEEVMFDKIYQRIKMLAGINTTSSFSAHPLSKINPHTISQQVIQGLYDGINTTDIDNHSANLATSLSIKHYEYGTLAARIIVSNHHKNTLTGFRDKMTILYMNKDKHQKANQIISSSFYKFVKKNQLQIESAIEYNRDYLLDFFAFKTLEKLYLLYTGDRESRHIIERPQDLFMRVAIFIHAPKLASNKQASPECIRDILETYNLMSLNLFTHATPTLFNAGLVKPSLLSCFLLVSDDSLESIMKAATDCAHISKNSGGIGISISGWRSEGSMIRSSGGKSSGTVPFARILNNVARAFNQGGGKRLGSIACYMEPHHPDILAFLNLKRNHGDENLRARDLFLALWVSDLFMERVRNNEEWSLFDPDYTPGLTDVYGDDYRALYCEYEEKGLAHRTVRAREVWQAVFNSQKESGVPYICYKDTVNRYSSQKNIGTIKCSNLCVSGDTVVLTEHGYENIKVLTNTGGIHKVWNGHEWSLSTFAKTSDSAELLEISFSDGNVLKCTPYHKFYVTTDDVNEQIIEASDLKIGTKISKFKFPIIDKYQEEFKYAYTHGLQGNLSEKNIVPFKYSIKSRLEWLAGLFDRYGCLYSNGTSIQLYSVNFKFLQNVKYLCNSLGVNPLISMSTVPGMSLVHDENNDAQMLLIKKCYWMLVVNSIDTHKLYDMGLTTLILSYNYNQPGDEQEFISVVNIARLEKPEPTYCFSEPLRHKGVFNGILTGQCAEIMEHSSSSEYACCTLSSICLSKFVIFDNENIPSFDYDNFRKIVTICVRNLNKVIDKNNYPVPETKKSNIRHRPLAIGIQGLHDVFFKFKWPFESEQAASFNRRLFEVFYYEALRASNHLARETYQSYVDEFNESIILNRGEYTNASNIPKTAGAYSSFLENGGCPLSQGIFQFEIQASPTVQPLRVKDLVTGSELDWEGLRKDIVEYGVRNSLLIALMPTASTSQIMGNVEGMEPLTSNMYKRPTLAGEFIVINKYLMRDLQDLNLYDEDMERDITLGNGSIQHIARIPPHIRAIYKTTWEIKQKNCIDLAADRTPFIDQSQSLNLYIEDLTFAKFNSMHFYGWTKGLKTGCYYLRSRSASRAQTFTIEPEQNCVMCSS